MVIDTGYGHFREVKNTLFKVVTQMTITNQAITQNSIAEKENVTSKSVCFKKQRICNSNKRDVYPPAPKRYDDPALVADSCDSTPFLFPQTRPFHPCLPSVGFCSSLYSEHEDIVGDNVRKQREEGKSESNDALQSKTNTIHTGRMISSFSCVIAYTISLAISSGEFSGKNQFFKVCPRQLP